MDLSADYFALFGLPAAFDLDQEALAQRYREAQRQVHPDHFASASEAERRLAMQKTAQLNEAFQTLKQPLSRARYLLQLKGVTVSDRAGAMDTEFLMEQMELRETLGEIRDQADPPAAFGRFLNFLEERMEARLAELGRQLQGEQLQAAEESVRKLQFFKRLHEEALALEESL